MIRFFDVTKRFSRRIWALKNVSMEIPKGANVLLRGDSGSGKTTLLKMIYAMERPDTGHVMVAGRNIFKLRKSTIPYLRRQIGFVFQDLRLMENRTVQENVIYPLQLRGVWGRKAKRRAEKAVELVGLKSNLNRRCKGLSMSEKQLLVLARAVAGEPALLLVDEPTAHMDSSGTSCVLNLLTQMNNSGTTVVLATGDELVAENFQASHVFELNSGELHIVKDLKEEKREVEEQENVSSAGSELKDVKTELIDSRIGIDAEGRSKLGGMVQLTQLTGRDQCRADYGSGLCAGS